MLKLTLYGGVFLVLLLFWAVGAYGRLARLRTGVARALEPLDRVWQQQLEQARQALSGVDQEQAVASTDPVPGLAEDAARQRLVAAVRQFELGLHRLRERPTQPRTVEMLELARRTLHQSWKQGLGEAEVPPDDGGQEVPPESENGPSLQQQWAVLGHQEQPPLAAFNAAMRTYDRAVSQFPAVLLARWLGFRRGRQLARDPRSRA